MQAERRSTAAPDWADYQEETLVRVVGQLIHGLRRTPAYTLPDGGCGSGLFCELAVPQG